VHLATTNSPYFATLFTLPEIRRPKHEYYLGNSRRMLSHSVGIEQAFHIRKRKYMGISFVILVYMRIFLTFRANARVVNPI
jgi:hypothetical protein